MSAGNTSSPGRAAGRMRVRYSKAVFPILEPDESGLKLEMKPICS